MEDHHDGTVRDLIGGAKGILYQEWKALRWDVSVQVSVFRHGSASGDCPVGLDLDPSVLDLDLQV